MKPEPDLSSEGAVPARRRMLHQLLFGTAWAAGGSSLAGCGGSDDPAATPPAAPTPPAPQPPPPPPPPPPPSPPPPPPPAPAATPLSRLRTALAQVPPSSAALRLSVSQGPANVLDSGFGATARHVPARPDSGGQTLATAPQLWGFARAQWTAPAAGTAVIGGQSVYPVRRVLSGATLPCDTVCGLHFTMRGSAFELLPAGSEVALCLQVDGRYAVDGLITRTLVDGVAGARLDRPNAVLRVDFGSAAPRRISVYLRSTQGPCSLTVAADDDLQPWDRSAEASMACMADSYGGAASAQWGVGGVFLEAAAALGIAHAELGAIGGTGYAPNSAPGFGNPGDAFGGRLAAAAVSRPDLFFTAGGINDNNALALPPYATAEAARAGFDAAVTSYHRQLRSALPDSVLVSMGPWAPRESVPTEAAARAKADSIAEALKAAGGPWVFLDNLAGTWVTSSGARGGTGAVWQTGTGTSIAPAGNGNGDLYLSADGVHPNPAGARYLAGRIADDLRLALATL